VLWKEEHCIFTIYSAFYLGTCELYLLKEELINNNPEKVLVLWRYNDIPIRQCDIKKYLEPTFPFLIL